ncbi:type III-B CRISPR-associated protein Cas10/Cmr2 [Ancylobacter sp. WKF20]|uniref:Cas10/Cmr2 second palm domain-containing protein n=1 Tax=Ancylobacter sp. WKF20 TaxID=3039801 RepID=UPI002434150C|nr:type III-B CRISPR-associated protein Cas10/Cmr2 [Ancylobacter sp. WKF20]WGD28398.1 type III-B CRISPR-associated protein Cas10/Cmr2 [Ancylobacter sp. WKF20]
MSENRLHFHLGPVAGFVGSARRTRDVWAGSFILSWLSASALHAALTPLRGDTERVISPFGVDQDPTFRAICLKEDRANGRKTGEPTIRPFLGTFPNQFILSAGSQHAKAAAAATKSVRDNWKQLGAAVASFIFDAEIEGSTLGTLYPDARNLFMSQIHVGDLTPMWEILTVVDHSEDRWRKLPDIGNLSPMALRKLNRWSADTAALPPEQTGALCTMLPGWREISAIDGGGSRKDERREFWAKMRAALLARRYPGAKLTSDWECLDLRPTEQLSAPALVKRVFPLLPEETLVKIIGWMPLIEAPELPPSLNEPNAGAQLLQWAKHFFFGRMNGGEDSPSVAEPKGTTAPSPKASRHRQIMLWPSTSYMAAAHWLEKVQRQAHGERARKGLADAVEKAAWPLRVAERTLFVKCTSIENRSVLADVDGACFFDTSVQRLIRQANERPAGKKSVATMETVAQCLQAIYDLPLDPDDENSPRIGAPAPIYAVIHVDGDQVGKTLAEYPHYRAAISGALADFIGAMRGRNNELGIIAESNGVTLYAAADEIIAMCPLEDAIDLALKINDTFDDKMKAACSPSKAAKKEKVPDKPPTLSVAITFAHRQVPLTWVLESGKRLLDDVAKREMGRAALAIEVLDAGGRRLDWGANWQSPNDPIKGLSRLLSFALGRAPAIGSNQFIHAFAETLAPLLLDDPTLDFRARLEAMREEPEVPSPSEQVSVVALALISHLFKEFCKDDETLKDLTPMIAGDILAISRGYWKETENEKFCKDTQGLLSGNGLRLLRFMVENWRGDPPVEVNP